MDGTTALLKSGGMRRQDLLAHPREAGVGSGHLWQARMAIYGLADGPGAFYHTPDAFLRRNEVRETQAGATFVQPTLNPCVCKIGKVH